MIRPMEEVIRQCFVQKRSDFTAHYAKAARMLHLKRLGSRPASIDLVLLTLLQRVGTLHFSTQREGCELEEFGY